MHSDVSCSSHSGVPSSRLNWRSGDLGTTPSALTTRRHRELPTRSTTAVGPPVALRAMNIGRDGLGARRVLGPMRLFGDVRECVWNSTSNMRAGASTCRSSRSARPHRTQRYRSSAHALSVFVRGSECVSMASLPQEVEFRDAGAALLHTLSSVFVPKTDSTDRWTLTPRRPFDRSWRRKLPRKPCANLVGPLRPTLHR